MTFISVTEIRTDLCLNIYFSIIPFPNEKLKQTPNPVV